eukprot:scaffold11203_cov153-Skeletonema_marinoi.AAC.2
MISILYEINLQSCDRHSRISRENGIPSAHTWDWDRLLEQSFSLVSYGRLDVSIALQAVHKA